MLVLNSVVQYDPSSKSTTLNRIELMEVDDGGRLNIVDKAKRILGHISQINNKRISLHIYIYIYIYRIIKASIGEIEITQQECLVTFHKQTLRESL